MGRVRSGPWPANFTAYKLQHSSDAVMGEHVEEVAQSSIDIVMAKILRIVLGQPGNQAVVHHALKAKCSALSTGLRDAR